ncbi:hypothetical protein QBC41DRAFT_283636 [Cercophora samala]|uniref:Cyanovirin-N domain-containing protein n=1 Tax=Cercophora samala TaxID=330535 RepID=A0AA40D7M6_9PEZI|nr:hypothetical protein QBC41DRAFT_283636 [Cercophora samala]
MAFQLTSRGVHLSGSTLHAECRDWNSDWISTSLELDEVLGNSDGKFSLSDKNFSHSAKNLRLLRGSKLSASLRRRDGQLAKATFDLNLCVANINGHLQFQKPSGSLLTSASCYQLDGKILKALCLGYDGLFHASKIDLNEYYENDNGDFTTGRHFYYSARNVSILPSAHSLLLKAELKGNHWYSGDFWNPSEIDLVTCLFVGNGCLGFEKHDGLFDRDGPVAKFFEGVPFVGFIVAGIQALAGNEEHAKRALAICANSSIVCCGILVGVWMGGPIGAALGAGLATPLGIFVETQIAGTIKDPQLLAQFEEATIGRYLYETLRNVLAAGAAAYLSSFLSAQAGNLTASALGEIASSLSSKATGFSSSFAASWLLKKVADALLKGKIPTEWIEIEERVKEL